MTLTLQEMVYLEALKNGKLASLPGNLKIDMENKFGLRILKAWRRSKKYKKNFIQNRIEEKEPVTKGALIHFLIVKELSKNPTILDLISKIHGYFHKYNIKEHLTNQEILNILSIIMKESKNDAHMFFGQLESLFSHSDKIKISEKNIIKIMSALPKKILLGMVRKSLDE